MKVICVTGSVGSGKTKLSKDLAEKLRYEYVDVTKLIKENKLYEKYINKEYIVDVNKLNSFLIKKIKNSKKNLIIDSFFSHYLPSKYIDLCIVTSCNINVLGKRLKKRGYSKNKIDENLQVEIFDVLYLEAKEKKHNLLIVDTSKGYNINEIANYVRKC